MPALAGEGGGERFPLEFTGRGGEYFGIWIVNLLLTILTLGIYSAWAKVRRLQYFYRNTQLAGASFNYHGNPRAILKGRLIAVAMLVAYQVAGGIHPGLGLLVAVALALVLPRLLLRSLQFRLANSSYRGLRFHFDARLKDAYRVFLGWPLLAFVTIYLLAPFCHQRLKQFQHDNATFGQTRFSFTAPVRAFYALYFKMAGVLVLGGILIAVLGAALYGATQALGGGRFGAGAMAVFPLLSLLVLLFFIRPFFEALSQNLVWNHTQLSDHRFVSTASVWRLFWIRLSNLFAVLFTLGFYHPFAVVRLLRYRLQTVSVLAAGDLGAFVAGSADPVGATGEETAELFDIDIAL
ncbi:YjgN family protein [uncultured Propionivibrio sp.]|uniref:YjgN family protein n=1 Tax=uncultured Propionivibrio sp. TaxID=426737 RepID=UPI0029C0E2CF|nr:YjgN family protein [uncultured Propionivibrio sp.]